MLVIGNSQSINTKSNAKNLIKHSYVLESTQPTILYYDYILPPITNYMILVIFPTLIPIILEGLDSYQMRYFGGCYPNNCTKNPIKCSYILESSQPILYYEYI